ncbi:hypothetical protein QQY66_26485 [Streptomyces sp. DG2A-72]|uniref:hypothetical protein n=1 Tax=Streptomyces sp. DG2A-72 TaxID=3051386 RepID=UPI00265BBB93|nr:hypothetical protein [Streptomyces sp. DG2A-72]MDO0935042.1 hypothetical protein [Streptomyces sp. DG2A-72]
MTSFLLALRSSPLRWLLVPLVALDLTLILARDGYWHGLWGDTGAAGQVPTLFLGVFAAAAAAWTSSLRRPPEVAETLSAMPRPGPQAELPRIAVVLCAFLVPYLVGQAVCFAVTASSWPPGFTQYLGYLLLGVSSLMTATGLGWVLGRLLSRRWGPAASALGWLLIAMAFDTDLSVVNGPARMQPDLLEISLRAAAALLLLVACLWLPYGPRITRVSPLPGLAVVLALAATAAAASNPVVDERHGSRSKTCVKGRTEICLWPEEEKYKTMAQDVLTRTEHLPRELAMPKAVYSLGLVYTMDRRWGGDFDLDSGSTWAMADGVTMAISAQTFAACREKDFKGFEAQLKADDQSVLALERWLEKRLAGGGEPEYREEGMTASMEKAVETGKEMADRPETEQRAWATATVRHVLEKYCD